jgi:hypothetical protein
VCWKEKRPFLKKKNARLTVKRQSKLVLPTPASPISSTLNTMSYCTGGTTDILARAVYVCARSLVSFPRGPKIGDKKMKHARDGCVAIVLVLLLVSVVSGASFRADYPISSITQDEGTRLTGSAMTEGTGVSVAGGGDVDGDGVADFVVGAWSAESLSSGASSAGHAYVLYGVTNASDAAATWPTDTTIKAIAQDSTRGRIIDGAATNTYLG